MLMRTRTRRTGARAGGGGNRAGGRGTRAGGGWGRGFTLVLARAGFAALLGVAAALVLVACGSSGRGLIPEANAGPLQNDFEAIAQAAQAGNGNCTATTAAINKAERDFAALPATVDAALRNRLSQGISNLRERALELCAEPLTPTTTTTTPRTTTTASPTHTQTTPAPTPTATTPATTTHEPTTSSAPSITPPVNNGGGTAAPKPGSESGASGGTGVEEAEGSGGASGGAGNQEGAAK